MNRPAPNWDDLRPRLITGAALIVAGIVVIWMGGPVFALTAAIVTGIMVWELARMIAADKLTQAVQLAVLTALAVLLARAVQGNLALIFLIIPAIAGVFLLKAHPTIFGVTALGIVIAGYGLTVFRDVYGVVWLFWLVVVVAGTDIAGYFGGRMIGGAKFWPSISPKKTWAGILAGWVAAAVIGLIFLTITDAGRDLVWISVLLSFASQMGDISQSWVKRRMGVKDSSALLPGHGGLWDRFDALLGASLFMLLTALIVDVPDLNF